MAPPPPQTVADAALVQLDAIADALGLPSPRVDTIRETVADISDRCGYGQRLDRGPRWATITDDCTPIEWSVGFRPGGVDIRIGTEAQADPASVASYWDASADLTDLLVDRYGLDDTVWQQVRSAFAPIHADALAASYHGIEFPAEGGRGAKVYVNPGMVGDRWETARAAFAPLGLGPAIDHLTATVGEVDLPLVAIYLAPPESGRIKLYLRSRSLEPLLATGDLCDPPMGAQYLRFADDLFPDRLPGRPAMLSAHYGIGADSVLPQRCVFSIPVLGPCDAGSEFTGRFARVLEREGLDADSYLRLVAAVEAAQPAGTPVHIPPFGLQSWVSFQRLPDDTRRVTVYFRIMAFAPRYGWLAADGDRTWPSPVADDVEPVG